MKALNGWKLSNSSQPFYPFGIECIGSGSECAILVWAAHSVETLVFRNFKDAIGGNAPVQKSYLLPSLLPETITAVAVGSQESVVLMRSGALRYFKSPRKLLNVDYLSNVKAICSCREGFALIKLDPSGSSIFIEIHPDAFPRIDDEDEHRTLYDISLESSVCQSTWKECQFVLKELCVKNSESEQFFRYLLHFDESCDFGEKKSLIFFVADCNFHVLLREDDHEVISIRSSTCRIIDFWLSDSGNQCILLLESGVIEIIHYSTVEGKIAIQKVHLGSEVLAYAFGDSNTFIFSDGFKVFSGRIRYDEISTSFKFDSKSLNLAGIADISIIQEHNVALCISENCIFYTIPLERANDGDSDQIWMEVKQVKRQLNSFKQDIAELAETYENMSKELVLQKEMLNAVALKSNISSNEELFMAKVTISRTQPVRSCSTTILVTNSEHLDRGTYFAKISIIPTKYTNKFNSHLWNIRCLWQEVDQTNRSVNLKVFNDTLLRPFDIHLMLRQSDQLFYLPEFVIDVNTPVMIGSDFVYLSFSVKVKQSDVGDFIELHHEMPVIFPSKKITLGPSELLARINQNRQCKRMVGMEDQNRCLTYRIRLPTAISWSHFVTEAIPSERVFGNETSTAVNNIVYLVLMNESLELTYVPAGQAIQLKSRNPGVMFYGKVFIYKWISANVKAGKKFNIPSSVLDEYSVSIRLSSSQT